MRISKPLFVTIILSSVASGIALTHMNNVPAFVRQVLATIELNESGGAA